MTNPLPIPASAIEAAKSAFAKTALTEKDHQFEKAMDAALRAAFDDLGMERDFYEKPTRSGEGPSTKYRLVSRWMPVNDVVEEA